MKRSPLVAALCAVAAAFIVTTTMDANGLTEFSALPLLPIAIVVWFALRLRPAQIGLVVGRIGDYALALAYPIVVLGLVCAIAFLGHATQAGTGHSFSGVKLAVEAIAGVLAALITEEGFFRGTLWAALANARMRRWHVLVVTSCIFALWHLSYATLAAGYQLPLLQVVVFIVNAAVIGAIWGVMRLLSGSIIVTAVSHSVWNALAYMFFGEGPKIGALGVTQTLVYAPEVGFVGLILNGAFLVVLLAFARMDT